MNGDVDADANKAESRQSVSREEFSALLDLQEKMIAALDQCVGIYGKITQDLRQDLKALREEKGK